MSRPELHQYQVTDPQVRSLLVHDPQRLDAKLDEIAVYTMETKKPAFRGGVKPPCPHCKHLLNGAKFHGYNFFH